MMGMNKVRTGGVSDPNELLSTEVIMNSNKANESAREIRCWDFERV